MRHVLIGTALLIILVAFYLKTNPIVFSEHERFDGDLHRLQALDATLNEDVLKARLRLLEDYDGFPQKIDELKRTVADLAAIPAFVSDAGHQMIREKRDALTLLLAQKDDLLEQFKSQNAVLNNSLRYLPVTGTELVALASADEQGRELESLLNELMRKVLVYSLQSSEDQTQEIQRSLGKLAEWRSRHDDFAQAGALASLSGHVNSILRRKPKVEALIQQVVSFPVNVSTQDLLRTYDAEFSTALRSADFYRVALYLLCALLVAGIGSTIFALDAANTHLEHRVAERTGDLSRKNEELQASDEKFHQLADHITDAFWIRSPDMREVHYISPGFERIWGRSRASLYANPHAWADFILPEDRERVLDAFAALTGDARSLDMEYRIVRPDDEIRWVRVRGFQVRNAEDQVIRHTGIATDITERKQIEEAMRESEERFSGAFEHAPIGVALVSPDGCRWLKGNRALCDLLGCSEAELLTQTVQDLTHPDDLAASWENVRRAIAGEVRSVQIEKRYIHKDGHIITALVNISLVRDGKGHPLYFIAQIQDITARQRSEAALQESEQRYHSLFENMLEGYAYCRTHFEQDQLRDFTYIEVNSAFEKLTGLTDVAGKDVSDILPGLQVTNREIFELYGRVALTGKPEKFETYVEELGIWLSITVYSSEREHFVAVFDNITERKRAEEALRTSEAEFRTLAEAMPQMVWITRPDGWNIYFSQRWMDYTGLTLEESLGHGWNKPFHPDDQQRAWDAWRHATSTISIYSLECRLRRADGVYRWWLIRGVPQHDAAGHILKWFGTCTDIHDLKRAELEISRTNCEIERLNADLEQRVVLRTEEFLAATQEAVRANRAKSEFLSRTSHELRTPMNAILGFGQLLEMEESLGPEPRESVEQILHAGRHLMTLIDEVLNISNAESGTMTLSLEPVAVDQLITETLSLIGSLESTLQLELERAYPAGGSWKVLADPQRLKQVLLNLLSNAIKYNRPGGKVIVEFAPAEAADPPAFRFSVQDTGPGISPEKLPRLFTPFDRLDAERTHTHIVGTGLGLALSKRMIELMGGRIGVESVVGEGTTFWVEMPLAGSPIAPSGQNELPSILNAELEIRNARTLLYIEDNPSNLRLVTRILARRPTIQLHSAATGTLGLEMAFEHRPDLILLDLHLPDLNGDQVLAQLRTDPRTSEIPVVMLSADNLPNTRERMLAAGARAFLTKPIEVRALLGAFDRFIEFTPEAVG